MFQKDLSHIGWDEVKKRQEERLPLVQDWIQLTHMTKGQTVVDIGPGPGVFTREYARVIGASGRVFAVEKSPEATHYLGNELSVVENVEILLADAEEGLLNIPVPNVIFVTDILHHTNSPEKVIRGISNLATADVKILISEFDPDAPGEIGPPLEHRLSREYIVNMVMEFGLLVEDSAQQQFEHFYVLARKPL